MNLSYSVYVQETDIAYECRAKNRNGAIWMPLLGARVDIIVDDVKYEGIVVQHSLDMSEIADQLSNSMPD